MQKFFFALKICILSTDREEAMTCPQSCSRYLAELDKNPLSVLGSQQYAVPASYRAMLEGFGTKMTQWRLELKCWLYTVYADLSVILPL